MVIQNVEAGDGHTDRVVKVKLSSKFDATREVARMEGRYPRTSGDDDDDAVAREREAILLMVVEGRKRWREYQLKEQAALEREVDD